MAFDRMAFIKKFSVEAREHLEKIGNGLMALEKDPNNTDILNEIFRSAHTLKGSARMLKLLDINQIAHKMEDLLGLIKDRKLSLTSDITDLLLENCDVIDECLSAAIEERSSVANIEKQVEQLEKAIHNEPFQLKTSVKSKKEIRTDSETKADDILPEPEATMQIQEKSKPISKKKKQDDVSLKTLIEEIDPQKPDTKKIREEIKTVKVKSPSDVKSPLGDTIRIQISRLDNLIKLISEIVLERSRLDHRIRDFSAIFNEMKNLQDTFKAMGLEQQNGQVARMADLMNTSISNILTASGQLFHQLRDDFYHSQTFVNQIKDEVFTLRMVKIATIFNTFPRAVRGLAREFGKKIDLEMSGENTELDKKMIEDLNDPLVHLIRNAVDHGIEDPEERIKNGKPETGRIRLSAKQGRGKIIIEIKDDGRGIDIEKIKESAIRKKLATPEELDEISKDRLYDFLFLPGFSTSRIITDISGRGVGLDVVRKNVEDKLKGTVDVQPKQGGGTVFTITLPITLATAQALLIRVADQRFVIPYSYVEETHARSSKEIIKVVDKTAINVRDKILPLVFLSRVLKLTDHAEIEGDEMITIILHSGQDRMVFIVDEIIDEQEVVIKRMGSFLQKVTNISGFTILGDGEIVSILHVPDLILSARMLAEAVPSHLRKMKRKIEKQRILVVDDSLNTREVEKNILEAHDYEVEVAIDGQDAIEIADKSVFDLVVTDIEMPRMNGFELTKRLRNHENYKNTPIIIVTSRDKEEDRKKGIEIGADAYITKSAFDESNLIDTIETLIGPV